MTEQDKPTFATLLIGLGETYSEPVSDARLEIYWRALSDLPIEALQGAATVHANTSRFFPKPVELREAVEGIVDDRAELAWSRVRFLVRRYGYTGIDGRGKPPTFPDPVTERAAMDLYGGWRGLCESLPAEGVGLVTAAKQFKASFAAYARQGVRESLALPSRSEAANRLTGLKAELESRGLSAGGL